MTVLSIKQQQEEAISNLKKSIISEFRKGLQSYFQHPDAQLSSAVIESLLQATRNTLDKLGLKDLSLNNLTITLNEETGRVEVTDE